MSRYDTGYQHLNEGATIVESAPSYNAPFKVTEHPEGNSFDPQMSNPYQQNPKRGILAVVIVFLVLAVVLIGAGIVAAVLANGGNTQIYKSAFGESYIAELSIEGEIAPNEEAPLLGDIQTYNHNFTMQAIDELMNDPSNAGMILYLNTPGGTVYESDEVYLKLKEYRDTGRPVVAVMGSICASGGYYIACAANKIFANRNTLTGSIGVTFGEHIDISKFLAEHGITVTDLSSGDNKSMGSIFAPLTKEQKEIFEDIIAEPYNQFFGIVRKEREISRSKLRPLADGRIFTAQQAKKAKLVDRIGTVTDAEDMMLLGYQGSDNLVIKEISPEKEASFWQQLLAAGRGLIGRVTNNEIDEVIKNAKKSNEAPLTYLYRGK